MNAKFIVIEGIDGSGKSTQIHLLADKMRSVGRTVAVTAEPTTSSTGGLVRDALSGFTPRSGSEIAALFMADRVAHNRNPVWGIEKLLADGKDVLCDRYYYSSLAYQGLVTDPEWVRKINLECPDIRKPDLCIFLDVDFRRCGRRIDTERAFLEIYENDRAQEDIRARYFDVFRELSGRDRIRVIPADRSPEDVAEDVFSAVTELW